MENVKSFIGFKVKQYLRLNGVEITKENIASVMKNKELVSSFMKEAISAGC